MSSAFRMELPERRRVALPLFLALFLTYAYGVQSPFNDNAVSRMALAVTAVTEGRLSIEPFHEATVDKAFRDGRYYSDKAPGLSFAAMPVVAIMMSAGGVRPGDLVSPARGPGRLPLTVRFATLVLVATPLLSGLATALAACALYATARRLGRDPPAALVATLAFALGTPAWGWATAFFGHALAGALCFVAFALTISLLEASRPTWGWVAVGFLLGYSVFTEYPLIVPATIVAGVATRGAARHGAGTRAALGIAVGAAGPAAVLLAYNQAVTGGWSSVAYEHVVGFEGMRQGFLGVSYPRTEALWGILFSARRGLVGLSPVVAIVPLAFWRARRSMPTPYWVAALAVVLYFLVFNASYVYWDGGYSTGPRHLTPALAFACLPLAWVWGEDRRARAVFGAALALSIGISGACAVTTMAAPSTIEWPLRDLVLPMIAQSEISTLSSVLAQLFPASPFPSGVWSLLPLALVWAVAALVIRRGTRGRPALPERAPSGAPVH